MNGVAGRGLLATAALLVLIVVYRVLTVDLTPSLFAFYSLAVIGLVVARFFLAWGYRTPQYPEKHPTATVVVPAKNEGQLIYDVIQTWARSDYPRHLFELLVIDDGSTDTTWSEIKRAERDFGHTISLKAHRFEKNQGKRKALAWAFRQSQSEVLVVSDSDSYPSRDALREIVKPFADPKIGGVVGHARVRNTQSLWAKMQAPWYHIAFKLIKSAESRLGSVVCLSGCLAAYRRNAVASLVDEWENQTFLGAPCTFGDDRSLTGYLLRADYKTVYWKNAQTETVVPDSFKGYWRQQLRWRKSWLRETWLLLGASLKRGIGFSLYFLAQAAVSFLGFIIVLRVLLYIPFTSQVPPHLYLLGLGLVGLLYWSYHDMDQRNGLGRYIILYMLLHTLVLVWLTPIALLKIRESKWGSRGV